jgi:hypothetical protein
MGSVKRVKTARLINCLYSPTRQSSQRRLSVSAQLADLGGEKVEIDMPLEMVTRRIR